MKKQIALLLCLLTTLSLFSCDTDGKDPPDPITENEHEEEKENTVQDPAPTDKEEPDTPTVPSSQYYSIEELGLTTVRYSIYNKKGETVLTKQTDRPLQISMLGETVVDICISMGTGLSVHTYYDVNKDRFSQEYTCVADATERLVAYVKGSLYDRCLVVRHIFDKTVFYKEFTLDFSPLHIPIEYASFTENEKTLHLSFLTETPPIPITVTLPIRTTHEESQECYLVYWGNGDGTCTVSTQGNQITDAQIPQTSPTGERVTALGNLCFYSAEHLTRVVLPNSIQTIGEYAFDGCTSLDTIVFEGSREEWERIEGAKELSEKFRIEYKTPPLVYRELIDQYRGIIDVFPQNMSLFESKDILDTLAQQLKIAEEDRETFEKLVFSSFLFYAGRGQSNAHSPDHKLPCGYAIRDLNGDGVDELVFLNEDYVVIAVFSVSDGKPVLLAHSQERDRYWIDENGWLHNNGSSGADASTNAVYRIAQGGGSLELIAEFGTNGHEWIGNVAYTKYYHLVNGEPIQITQAQYVELEEQYGPYLSINTGAAATKEQAGLRFIPLFSKAEIARETLQAALNNEIRIYDTDALDLPHEKYLMSVKIPYPRVPLWDVREDLAYAFVDMDGDGIEELVIDCGDTLVLRYYQGTVYSYGFIFRNIWRIKTDGSFSWNHAGQEFEHGTARLVFEGTDCKTERIWYIVNDGEPDARYYIGETEVSLETLLQYIENEPNAFVTFSPIPLPKEDEQISEEEALSIASRYWSIKDGDIEYATKDILVHRLVLSDEVPPFAKGQYLVLWRIEYYYSDCIDMDTPYRTKDYRHLLINSITGTVESYFPTEGKG